LSFFEQLRRRKVIRVGAVYLVTAWLVLQIIDVVGGPLHLPQWTASLVVILLAIGLPIAIILAWAFELTPDGVQRTATSAADLVPPGQARIDYVIVALLVIAIGWLIFEPRESAQAPSHDPLAAQVLHNSIAVLPFANLSPDPNNAYFAAGMHEETLNQLAKIKDLSVIARTTMLRYANGDKTVPEIGRELNVGAVMEGSVRYAGERVRITAQLIDVGSGAHLWSEAYDRKLEDIFAIQSDIALNITQAMKVEFALEEQRVIAAIPTDNLQAYSHYMRAQAFIVELPPDISAGMAAFQAAIDLDPKFSDALAFKALLHSVAATGLNVQGLTPESQNQNIAMAKALAERALQEDPNQATAHAALSYVAMAEWRWQDGLLEAELAYGLDPNSVTTSFIYGQWLSQFGRIPEAVELFDRAIALDPLSASPAYFATEMMIANEQWGQARRYARQAINTAPDAFMPYLRAATVEAIVGHRDEATEFLSQATAQRPAQIDSLGLYAFFSVYSHLGQVDAAERSYQDMLSRHEKIPITDDIWWRVFAHRGEIETSLDHLHAIIDNRFPAFSAVFVAMHPDNSLLDPLRASPRFQAALTKLGVAATSK
jgi:adenylate cyclase